MNFADVRSLARERRCAALRGVETTLPAHVDELLQNALANERLSYKTIRESDIYSTSVRGMLNRRGRLVGVSYLNTDEQRRAVAAHELGHWFLHSDLRLQLTRINFPVAGGPVEGYSEAELKEVQADVFAAEFLCPCELVAGEFSRGVRPSALAHRLGLPHDLVFAQAAEALLGVPGAPTPLTSTSFPLDTAQIAAAEWDGSHLIVEGGPSSGKTTIIAARVKHLLASGHSPASIAVFARSEDATQRLRRDWNNHAGSVQIWNGTLLGFCKELLRKYAARIRRTPDFRVLDDVAAISLLREAAKGFPAAAGLAHWRLAARAYRDIATLKYAAISPLNAQPTSATVSKAADLFELYRRYEEALQRSDAVDAADLPRLAVELVNDDEVASRVAAHHGTLVVDDYEDTTAAEQKLLHRLVCHGASLFATASPAGSVNTFRGAAPDGIKRFETDYIGAGRLVLSGRHHCVVPEIDVIRAVAANRVLRRASRGGEVTASVARDQGGEARALAQQIAAWQGEGLARHEQVVLARTHSSLARLARGLRAEGLSVRYEGEALEQTEVADLLAIAQLRSDRSGKAVARVARLASYNIQSDEAAALVSLSRRRKMTAFEALPIFLADGVRGIAPTVSGGMHRLAEDLAGLKHSPSAFALVSSWLFERSDYLKDKGAISREAIRDFLGVCEEHARQGDGDDANLEHRLKRLRSRSQDSPFWRRDGGTAYPDAVRLMTIHTAQGRKFRGVHLAALPPGDKKRKPSSQGCEQVLFDVAISRANERLHLSRCLDDSDRWKGALPYDVVK